MSRDDAILLDIEEAIRLILAFNQGMDQEAFSKDVKTQSAVLHQLMVLGEAVKRLSDHFREFHSEVPWRLIAGMRDRLIHDYDDVDLDEVWRTIDKDIPDLRDKIGLLLPSDSNILETPDEDV